MIGVVARLKVKAGSEQRLEAFFAQLMPKVRALEPDVSMYQLFRDRANAGEYRVVEVYASEEALAAHMKSAHLREAMPELGACLAAPPQIEKFDAVGAD